MKTYIEIRRYKDNKCVKRLDVTGKTERMINTIENGMNRNLSHEEYFTKEINSKKHLIIIQIEIFR